MTSTMAAAILLALTVPALAAEPARSVRPPAVSVCFVPGEDCETHIVDAIAGAKVQVLVQAFGFSSAPILAALKAAAARGVEVLVILDKSNAQKRYTGATYMTNAGVPVWIDTAPGIAHSKVLVIDGELTVTGSYNFTRSAQTRNAENVLFIVSRPIALRFKANWDTRLRTARPYQGATGD